MALRFLAGVMGLALGLAPVAPAGAGEPLLVSRQDPSLGGSPADGRSSDPSIAAGGRLVAFASDARNLSDADVEDDINRHVGRDDVFVHDRASGATTLLSPPGPLSFAPSLSADGSAVVFLTAPGPHVPSDVHVRDLRSGALQRVGGGSSTTGYAYPQARPRLSGSGRIVVFATRARSGGQQLVAVDRATGRRMVAGPRTRGRYAGVSISRDGRTIAWTLVRSGRGADRVSVVRFDRRRRRRQVVDRYRAPCCLTSQGIYDTSLSADGRRLAYVGRAVDTRDLGRSVPYVFAHDRGAPRPRIVSRRAGVPISGTTPSLSADGRRLAFLSPVGGGRLGILVRDIRRGVQRFVAGAAGEAALSPDGRWVAFVAGEASAGPQAFVAPAP